MVARNGALAIGLALSVAAFAVRVPAAGQDEQTKTSVPVTIETFERSVRPVLAEHCTGCHGVYVQEAKLRLDSPAFIRKGGPRGSLINAKDPAKSILLEAIKYDDHNLMMPPKGRIPQAQIAAIEAWILAGAPMPADAAAPAPKAAPTTDFSTVMKQRRKHWAYLPVKATAVPKVANQAWVRNPIDAFIASGLAAQGLKPSPQADRRTLLRRVTFDLTGLPPTPDEITAFLADTRPDAYSRVVDRLLASPTYGERWGRHWLDLVRYGESMGHEFDFDMPNAWKYRDYVIRAFNEDVPYNRFLTEHLAGDTLANPRFDKVTGWNESITATGFFWLGEGKHSPTDVRQEQADRFDNQIDVIGKAMLGVSINCVRCHDHKFDPIPARDYYGLYGMIKSSRYEQVVVNDQAFGPVARDAKAVSGALDRKALGSDLATAITNLTDAQLAGAAASAPIPMTPGTESLDTWRATGVAFPKIAQPGDPILSTDPNKQLRGFVTRPMVHSGITPPKFEGVMRSPNFRLTKRYVHVRVAGRRSKVNLMVDNFIVIRGPIFDVVELNLDTDQFQWRTIDTQFWPGREAYLDVQDSPMATVSQGAPLDRAVQGWAAFDGYVISDSPVPPQDVKNPLSGMPAADVRAALLSVATKIGTSGPFAQADMPALATIDILARRGELTANSQTATVQQWAAIDARTPTAERAPGMADGASGTDEQVFVRGNHRALGEPAPRLQLAVTFTENKKIEPAKGSGRAEFARMITSSTHPLTARVMVNRLWHHHFGTGIVKTVDDFGINGDRPTNPALLDWMATNFTNNGWSVKKLHKLIVTSATYQQVSVAEQPAATRKDPNNRLLWKYPVRRLEAEAIRDNILAVSGSLNRTMYGPSVFVNLDPGTDGRGMPPSGPLDGNGRRTIYMGVRRNFMSTFFQAFDMPTPFTCIGKRTQSNVPAQALALMNSPFVREMANRWAESLVKVPAADRLDVAYTAAYGRKPSASETKLAMEFIGKDINDLNAWKDYCHVMFNVKEFIFIR
jgi:mono/diheme cytochrome c family protein